MELRDQMQQTMVDTINFLDQIWSGGTDEQYQRAKDNAVILAAIRALGAWITKVNEKEVADEIQKLHPMLLCLFDRSQARFEKGTGSPDDPDYRIAALEAMGEVQGSDENGDGGVTFMDAGGWFILEDALLKISRKVRAATCLDEVRDDIEIGDYVLGVLLCVVGTLDFPMEECNMALFQSYHDWRAPDTQPNEEIFAFQLSCLQFGIDTFKYMEFSERDGYRNTARRVDAALEHALAMSWMNDKQKWSVKVMLGELWCLVYKEDDE